MNGNKDPLPPSFTSMEFTAADGNGTVLSTHDPVGEIKDLYDNIEGYVDELRANKPPAQLETVVDETTIPRDLRQDILSLYALTVGVIEAYSADLLIQEIVDTEHQDSNQAKKFFEEDLSASKGVKMLLYTGIINEGVHGELQRVINKRNNYVHQHNESLSIENHDDFLADAKRCVRSTNKLAIELDGEDFRDL